MLVLSRLVGETIVVNDNIRITVVEIDRGKCRVGITAPRDVSIHREEVWNQIHANKSKIVSPGPKV